MSANYLTNPLEFLITTLFSLYILAVMLRFLLGAVRADFYNPISQPHYQPAAVTTAQGYSRHR